MDIKILFDSKRSNNKFFIGWGISFFIDNKILFDTGEKAEPLLHNMRELGINIDDIETIVISHDHFDHTGGLWAILEKKPNMRVYICPNFSQDFKKKAMSLECHLIMADSFMEIDNGIYTTGEITGKFGIYKIPEQSLVLKTKKGLTILTGCAHPGIINILEYVNANLNDSPYLVMGGFHLLDEPVKNIVFVVQKFIKLGVKQVAPSHCTGEDATNIFKASYGNNFMDIKVGKIINV